MGGTSLETFSGEAQLKKSPCITKVEMMNLEKWPSSDQPTVGTLVAVRFSEDGLIYRAKVGWGGHYSN